VFSAILVVMVAFYSNTVWGYRIRAIGENALLAKDFRTSESLYTFIGLGLTNAIVAFSGALFAQRSYSADVNMGVGQTIIGLIAMIIGLILAAKTRKSSVILIAIILGSVLHRAVIFITLQVGVPAESFKLVSALFFVLLFVSIKAMRSDFLEKLKWS
jgi:putative ABC transport system permease protein